MAIKVIKGLVQTTEQLHKTGEVINYLKKAEETALIEQGVCEAYEEPAEETPDNTEK